MLHLRPKSPFGYVIGISIVSEKLSNLDNIFSLLLQQFNFLNYQITFPKNPIELFKNDSNHSLYKIEKYKGLKSGEVSSQKIPKNVYNGLLQINIPKKKENLDKTIETFLQIISDFCDEKTEGTPLTYGFVLGNPGLLDFLNGKNVVPNITDKSEDHFLTLEELKSNIHLYSNHTQTTIIVPYLHDFELEESNCKLPFFTMPIEKFEQDIFNWDYGILIPSEFRPYAYLSYRFPWLISAVVGPYSQIRVFKGGDIIAFKDGKGWKTATDFSQLISSLDFSHEKIKVFLDFIRLFSPIYNPNSHGSLITYLDKIPTEEKVKEEYDSAFQELVTSEPATQKGWLKNKLLFDDENRLNYDVAKRLLQTCVLDGAISISGDNFEVNSYGMRLGFSPKKKQNDGKKVGGTKRQTAVDFIKWCKEQNIENCFAIAVSSDGPIRIYYTEKTKIDSESLNNGEVDVQTFTIFEKIK